MAVKVETVSEEKSQEISYKEITNYIFEELNKRNLLRKGSASYKNTEALLYKYNDLINSVKDREEEIDEVETCGLRGKSKSILKLPEGSRNNERDIEQDIIDGLVKDIKKTQLVINRIERVVSKFKTDKYYDIIRLKYFEGKTQQEIADYFEKDPTTIWRNNQRIINAIKVYFFPNDVIDELRS